MIQVINARYIDHYKIYLTFNDKMDLKTFITNTLTQIIEGVKEADNPVGKDDGSGCINPLGTKDLNVQIVSFDVALTSDYRCKKSRISSCGRKTT